MLWVSNSCCVWWFVICFSVVHVKFPLDISMNNYFWFSFIRTSSDEIDGKRGFDFMLASFCST